MPRAKKLPKKLKDHVADYHLKSGKVRGKPAVSVIYKKGGCVLGKNCPLPQNIKVTKCPKWPCGGLP